MAKDLMNAEYFPNQDDSALVKKYVRAGVRVEGIAHILNISEKNLKSCYPFELGTTDDMDLAVVADVAFNMAASGDHPSMTKWWLTVKGGWLFQENPVPTNPFQIILDSEVVEEENEALLIEDELEASDGEFVEYDPDD